MHIPALTQPDNALSAALIAAIFVVFAVVVGAVRLAAYVIPRALAPWRRAGAVIDEAMAEIGDDIHRDGTPVDVTDADIDRMISDYRKGGQR
jgi:hypothetical protein